MIARSVNEKCTTLCPVLDAFLRGGVPTRSLTEIAGEAGSAKTQLCLQLLLAAQLPRHLGGLGGAAVYVHTEGSRPHDAPAPARGEAPRARRGSPR